MANTDILDNEVLSYSAMEKISESLEEAGYNVLFRGRKKWLKYADATRPTIVFEKPVNESTKIRLVAELYWFDDESDKESTMIAVARYRFVDDVGFLYDTAGSGIRDAVKGLESAAEYARTVLQDAFKMRVDITVKHESVVK